MTENVKCNLCGSEKLLFKFDLKNFLYLPDEYNIATCQHCGLTFMSPRPTAEEFKKYYDSQGEYNVSAYIQRVTPRLGFYKTRVQQIEQVLKRKGRMLEVGCAAGHFLHIAQERGWEAYGLEISDPLSEYARKEFGLNVVTNSRLSEAAFPPESFEVIYSRHVLEHLMDPMGTLVEACRILKKGGLLFIEVPNQFNELRDRIKRMIVTISRGFEGILFRKPLSSIHHLYFFTPSTLGAMVRKAGFTINNITTYEKYPYKAKDQRPTGGYLLSDLIDKGSSWFGMGPNIILRGTK